MAGRSFCSLDTIRAIEQNRTNYRPSLEMAARLADILEIPTAQRVEFIQLARGTREVHLEERASAASTQVAPPGTAVSVQVSTLQNESFPQTLTQKIFVWHSHVSVVTLFLILFVPLLLLLPLVVWLVLQQQWTERTRVELTPGPIALENREPRVQVLAGGHAIANGDMLPRYARVTVKFTVENLGEQAVRIATLEAGARGPCAEKCTWASQVQTFNRVRNLLLQPGEIYAYEASRVFTQSGNYFIEPVLQDANEKYGGIAPFTRIEFRVESALSSPQ